MPRAEQFRHQAVLTLSRVRSRLASAGAVGRRLVPKPRAVLLFPLALGLAIAGIVFAIRASNGPTCTPVTQVSAATTHPAASKLCRTPPLGYLGHLTARFVST